MHAVRQDRLQTGKALASGLARPLVLRDRCPLARRTVGADHRRLERDDLALEPALGDRDRGLALRLEPEPVDVVTSDLVLLGDALSGTELVGHVPREVLGPRAPGPVEGIGAESDPTHRLDPAPDADLDRSRV